MARGRPRKSNNGFDYDRRMSWYLSHGWVSVREVAYERAGHKCSVCGAKGRLEAHHVVDPYPTRDVQLLLAQGNIHVLCAGCHRRAHARHRAATPCETCGRIVAHNPSQLGKRRFCSIACRDKHPDFKRLDTRSCERCGGQFQPTYTKARFCGHTCSVAATAELKRSRRVTFSCPTCGSEFSLPASLATRQREIGPFCSASCASTGRNLHRYADN